MKDFSDAISYLTKGVQFIVDNSIKVAPYDRTLTGLILQVNTDGTYNIKLDGNTYNNIQALKTSVVLNINDTVKVTIPQNQMNNMFILGKLG